MRSNLQVNKNIHAKLKEISEKRNSEGHPINTMAGIVAELVLKQHAKECKK